MAYNQFTSCVQPEDWVDLSVRHIRGAAFNILIIIAGIMAAIAAGAVFGAPGVIVGILVAMALVADVIVLLRWELFGKLVCLADDPICAILGMVFSIESPDPSENNGDDDTNLNLVLQPGPLPTKDELDKNDKEKFRDNVQGYLITENPRATHGYIQNGKQLKALHCELEGEGYRNLLDSFYALESLLIAALAIAIVFTIFNLSLFFPLLLAIIAVILAIIVGLENTLLATPPPPDPHVAGLEAGDFVVVKGKWVYDSLHEGWNEIHPVQYLELIATPRIPNGNGPREFKEIQVIDPATKTQFYLDSEANIKKYLEIVCDSVKNAEDAQEGGSRDNPEHGWSIHPSVDGCKPPIIIE